MADKARRADAQRNRAAILDSAVALVAVDPRASMSDIAQAAGIGRVTLYGHFASRAELLDAAFAHVMGKAHTRLAAVDLAGDPAAALDRLVRSSWMLVDEYRAVLGAAEVELGDARIRAHHDAPLGRVRALIERGQAEGVFRADQPAGWLVSCVYALLHGAAAEVRSGRLAEDEAAALLPETVAAVVAARS